jgi:putative tryptophan/tyrosine transport system substrate-binding protein
MTQLRHERANLLVIPSVKVITLHGETRVSARGKPMRRREFIALIGGATVAWPFASIAQEAGRTYRLGALEPYPRDVPAFIAFLDQLRRRGFIESQNLTIDYRDFGLHVDLISQYAAELVKAQVDFIEAGGGMAIRAAQQATKTIPILGVTDDMVGEGLVESLARPNGNTTGVSIFATELDGKRQEILIAALPGLRHMAALADSNNTTVAKLHALQEAARAGNIELSIHRIATGEEIAAAIDTATASGATALNVLASPMLFANRQLIMDRVAALRLPAIYQWPETAEGGAFAGYGPRFAKLRELEARQVVEVFRGIKPADIPVEQPTEFELVINLKTANALGVTVPPSLLARANEVIE